MSTSRLSRTEVPLPAALRTRLEADIAAAAAPRGLARWTAALFPGADRARSARAETAKAALARGTVEAVTLEHLVPPAVAEHEHGIVVFVSVAADRTLMLDVSSVGEDPRWALNEAGDLFRHRWHWLRLEGQAPLDFEASGPPVAPERWPELHGTALERHLTAGDGWPGDDSLLPIAWAELARLAKS